MKTRGSAEPAFGIIGCGGISRFHFRGLQRAGARVVHIADVNEEAARPWVERFGARYSADAHELLRDQEVTVVSILTNAATHRELALASLAAGKDVICEKTMTNNAAEARELVEAVRDSGKLFFTAYMKRFFPAVTRLKELLPPLGTLFSVHARIYQAWGNYYDHREADQTMRSVVERYGGAVLKCAASHMIDMILNLFGRPVGLYGHIDWVPNSHFDRRAMSIFEYPGGLTVCLEAATHPLRKIGYERNSWEEQIEINGTNGRLTISFPRWDQPENNGVLLQHYDNGTGGLTTLSFDPVNPFDLEIAAITNWLRQRTQAHPDVTDGYNVDLLIQEIEHSHRQRRSLPLEWSD